MEEQSGIQNGGEIQRWRGVGPLAELLPEVPPYDFVRRGMVLEGMDAAELEERQINDRTARNMALLLADEAKYSQSHGAGSLLERFGSTGEIGEEFAAELAVVHGGARQSDVREWADLLHVYALNRVDRGPVGGWAERLNAIDRAHHAYQSYRQEYRWAEVMSLEQSLTAEIRMVQERDDLVLEDDAIISAAFALARRRHMWREHFFVWIATGEATPRLCEELAYLQASGNADVRLWVDTLHDWAVVRLGQRLLPEAGEDPER